MHRTLHFLAIPLFTAAALLLGTGVYAHGDGASLEKQSDGYLVDIGYSPEQIRGGDSALFDFGLLRDDQEVNFESIWVRITQGNKTLMATGIEKPDIGRTVLTYNFPQEGEYELYVRFQDENAPLAEEQFPINVSSGETDGAAGKMGVEIPAAILFGALLGMGAGFFLKGVINKK